MYRFLLILLFAVAGWKPIHAQPQRRLIDSLTWNLYNSKRWESLLQETNTSLQKGIDFYYLRVRAGVAAYELKKYKLAVTHFRKAYQAVKKDEFVNSYFYWALIYSGREDEANGLADAFQPVFLRETGIKREGLLISAGSTSLVTFNQNFSGLLKEDLGEQGGRSLFRSLLKYQLYQGISVDLHLHPRLNLYQSVNYMDIRREMQTNSKVNLPENFIQPATAQFQYFVSGRYNWPSGWDFFTSFTKLWGENDYYYPSFITGGNADLSMYKWNISDYVIAAGIGTDHAFLRPGIEAGYALINNSRQLQGSVNLTVYPFMNLNLYLIPELTLHWDESTGKSDLVIHPVIGWKTGPFWLTGDYSYGRMKNYFSGGGEVVYNMPETIRSKWGVSLWAPLFKNRMDLTLKYGQTEKEGTTFVFSDAVNFESQAFKFVDHSLLISLRWNL